MTDYSLLSGVAQMQLGPPTIELPGDASATATFHTPVMVRYFPDPGATVLPAFMRGEFLTLLGVSASQNRIITVGLAGNDAFNKVILVIAIAFGTINIVGGFLVTDRMLEMFKRKPEPPPKDGEEE